MNINNKLLPDIGDILSDQMKLDHARYIRLYSSASEEDKKAYLAVINYIVSLERKIKTMKNNDKIKL
jgi:hypothetical protein